MINLPDSQKEKLNNVPASINYSIIKDKIEDILQKADNGHQFKSSEFFGYGGEDVRNLLKDVYKKCVYCEITGNLDIEHYRPKAAVRQFNGQRSFPVKDANQQKHPGYYWLAYEITNFLWVCHDCNAGKGGKHNKFPTSGNYVFKHSTNKEEWKVSSETLLSEQPLLLHPLIDNFENHLKIDHQGRVAVLNNSKKGTMTIGTCNLNRDSLWLNERKKIIDSFFKKIHSHLLYLLEYDNEIMDQDVERLVLLFKSIFDEIRENMNWDKKFSRVYWHIYNDFAQFVTHSKVNGALVDEERRFLIIIFNHYRNN